MPAILFLAVVIPGEPRERAARPGIHNPESVFMDSGFASLSIEDARERALAARPEMT
jgi:hypothetical protein